jgi:hypothetical protein
LKLDVGGRLQKKSIIRLKSVQSTDNIINTQGTVNISATYDSRSRETETSVVARGDLWRVEASRGGNVRPGSDSSSLFLVQLGPVLFVRDSTLLLPIHLSKQHLLWYGYDRKVLQFSSIYPDVI